MLDLPRSFWKFSRSVQEVTDRHEVRICDDLAVVDDTEWNDLVESRPEGTIFHRHEWLRAVESAFDYRPCHVTARKDGNLVGVLPQFEMDLPKVALRQVRSIFPGFVGPVVGADSGAGCSRSPPISAAAGACSTDSARVTRRCSDTTISSASTAIGRRC